MSTDHSLDGITIAAPTAETLPSFARLTCTLLPIAYPSNFFNAVLSPPSAANGWSLARIAIWTANDGSEKSTSRNSSLNQQSSTLTSQSTSQVVAGIYGRIQPVPPGDTSATSTECQLYIATLAVLAPWRGRGIASVLLEHLTRAAIETVQATQYSETGVLYQLPGMGGLGSLTTVCAHVWETNDDALLWYRARHFEVGDVVKGYYRKLRPDGARMVRRRVLDIVVDGHREEDVQLESGNADGN